MGVHGLVIIAILAGTASALAGVIVVLARSMREEQRGSDHAAGPAERSASGEWYGHTDSIGLGAGYERTKHTWRRFVPAALILGFAVTVVFVVDFRPSGTRGALTVEVTGSNAGWRYHYVGLDVWSDGQLLLPARKTVRLQFVSDDVIRSFWVPGLGIDQTVIPDTQSVRAVTPYLTGMFPVLSTIDCGPSHDMMGPAVVVVPDRTFDTWAAGARGGAPVS